MRIEKLQIPKNICEGKGIEPINISRLGPVVALVGRNGAGKTRILDLIKDSYPSTTGILNILEESITHLPTQLVDLCKNWEANPLYKEMLITYYQLVQVEKLLKNDKTDETLIKKREALSTKIGNYQNDFDKRQLFQPVSGIATTVDPDIQSSVRKNIVKINGRRIRELQATMPTDNIKQRQQQQGIPIIPLEHIIKDIAIPDENDEFESIYNTALTFLKMLSNNIVGDFIESQQDKSFNFEDSTTNKQFTSLQRIVKAFLNKTLKWENEKVHRQNTIDGVTLSTRGILKLDERVFNYAQLSDGEKTLFAYCILFFILDMNPKRKIKDSIIIIDEPELNLHPESEIDIINGIRKIIEESGQLWIATHSLSILSSLNYDEIFMVKNNKIIPPKSSTPPSALVELMGLEGHQERVSNFLSDISNWAYENFMGQCFCDPETILSAQPNDPQVDVFKKTIKDNSTGSLLDFGAGKGRVLKELISNESLKNTFQLYALEPNNENHKELEKLNLKGYYKDYTKLPDNTFDFILLCNVLHEISINKWAAILNKLRNSLKDEGYLVIVEDMVLPRGEKIKEHGYIIMDYQSLKDIFNLQNEPIIILPSDYRYKDRILCSPIQKKEMGIVTSDSLKKALHTLKDNTLIRLGDIRNPSGEEKNLHTLGRKSAFYSQLFVNTHFAINQL